MSITPDLIEWLLADQKVNTVDIIKIVVQDRIMSRTTLNVMFLMKTLYCFQVCQSWKKLGVRMNLSCYVGYIQSQEKSNSASLRMLLRLWSSAKPESYNVKSLKRVLAAEVMYGEISI